MKKAYANLNVSEYSKHKQHDIISIIRFSICILWNKNVKSPYHTRKKANISLSLNKKYTHEPKYAITYIFTIPKSFLFSQKHEKIIYIKVLKTHFTKVPFAAAEFRKRFGIPNIQCIFDIQCSLLINFFNTGDKFHDAIYS